MSAERYVEYVFLKYILSSEFDDIAARSWVPIGELENHFRTGIREAFRNYGYSFKGKYDHLVEKHLQKLIENGSIVQEGDEYTGRHGFLQVSNKDQYVKAALAANDVSQRIDRLGEPALQRALAALSEVEDWQRVASDTTASPQAESTSAVRLQSAPDEEIPASDRVVSRGDNAESITAIEQEIDILRNTVHGDNEVGAELGDERELIDLELEIASEVIKRPRFRLRSLINWLKPALTFLIDKFSGGAIGEAAKRLLNLLLELI